MNKIIKIISYNYFLEQSLGFSTAPLVTFLKDKSIRNSEL